MFFGREVAAGTFFFGRAQAAGAFFCQKLDFWEKHILLAMRRPQALFFYQTCNFRKRSFFFGRAQAAGAFFWSKMIFLKNHIFFRPCAGRRGFFWQKNTFLVENDINVLPSGYNYIAWPSGCAVCN